MDSKSYTDETTSEIYQGLTVKYCPAPLGRRFLAYTVDLGIVAMIMGVVVFAGSFLVGLLAGAVAVTAGESEPMTVLGFGMFVVILFILGVLLIYHSYFIYLEHRYGDTFGKRMFGLSVIASDGGRPSIGQCIVRDALRYIDCALVVPGILAVSFTRESLRLGDMMAGTRVVYSRQKAERGAGMFMTYDYYQYLQNLLAPEEVSLNDSQAYLNYAFGRFVLDRQGRPSGDNSQDQKWYKLILPCFQSESAKSCESELLLLFFAEYCIYSMNDTLA